MTHRLVSQAAALVMSVVATLAMLGGIDHLSMQQHAATTLSAADGQAVQQVVVVTARRDLRS